MRKEVKHSLDCPEDVGSGRVIHLLFILRVVCRKEQRMKAERPKSGPDTK